MRRTHYALILGWLLLPLSVNALPRAESVPGGIAILPLAPATATAPSARYNNQPVLIRQRQQRWEAVVGIPLSAEPGSHRLQLNDGSQLTFQVRDKRYEAQYITLQNKRQVNPNPLDLERIRGEQSRSRRAFGHWSEPASVDTQFQLPVVGPISGSFGKRRFFNNQPRRPHSGLDIAAATGTPVVAPAAGRVVEHGNYFFNGNTVFVDHGRGLVSMFCHLDSYQVEVGDWLEAGQPFAEVGATGRVTGPHLHWSVSLNNARVDPSRFLSDELLAQLPGALP